MLNICSYTFSLIQFNKLHAVKHCRFYPHLRICLLILERGREGRGERNTDAREKHRSPLLQPRHVPRLGIEPAILQFTDDTSTK